MTEQQHPDPFEDQPAAALVAPPGTTGATDATGKPGPSKTKRWLAGAMLVTVGVVAGGGAAYALTTTPGPTNDVPGVGSGYRPDGSSRVPMGGRADDGTTPGTSTDGEPV